MSKFHKNIEKKRERDFKTGISHFEKGNYDTAEKIFKGLLKYYKSLNRIKFFNVKFNLIKVYDKKQDYIKAIPHIEESIVHFQGLKKFQIVGALYNELSNAYFYFGDLDKAKKYTIISLNLAKKHNFPLGVILNIMNYGNYLSFEGKFERALKAYREATELAEKQNFNLEITKGYLNLFTIYAEIGNSEKSELFFKKLIESKLENPELLISAYSNVAITYERKQQFEKQLEYLNKALELSKEHFLRYHEVRTSFMISLALINLMRFSKALDTLESVRIQSENINDNVIYGRYFYGKAIVCLFYKKFDEANTNFNKSLKIAKENNDIHFIIKNYKFLGSLYRIQKNYHESYRNLTQALNYYYYIHENINTIELRNNFKKNFTDLIEIIKEINQILELDQIKPEIEDLNAIKEISINTCRTATSKFDDLKIEKEEVSKQIILLNEKIESQRSELLEYYSKQLFSKMGFDIDILNKEFRIDSKQIIFLVEKKCYKGADTKSIEVDVFGKKNEKNRDTYLIVECKNKKKPIQQKEVGCFIAKASLIADQIIKYSKFQSKKLPSFKLVVISLNGFGKFEIKDIIDEMWSKEKKRLLNQRISMIDRSEFKKLLRENNINIKSFKGL